MTPEREKYLASITNDEFYIRDTIKNLKYRIFRDKHGLQNFKFDDLTIKELKHDIRECNVAICALKRQLPVPTLKFHSPCSDYLVCTACDNMSGEYCDYCYHCGRKLRK